MIKKTGAEQGVDNFEFALVGALDERPFLGYNSASDKTSISPQMMIRGSKNVYKKLSGTIAARAGLKLRGASDNTLAKVDASFEWNTWDGRCLPLRICNGNLQVESDIITTGTYVWYTLLSGLSKTRWIFDAWWDNAGTNNGQAKKDVLLMVDGTATLRNWSGGGALFVSYVATVITLDRNAATAGFDTQGSVIINGITYTYTGVSGSTLTGTSDASAAIANQPVWQVPVATANQPASGFLDDWLRVVDNHVYVGSYSSRLVYVSKTSTYLDYTQSTPRIPGDGELITLDANSKGMGVHNGLPTISAGTSLWYEISFSQITVGVTLSEQTKVSPIRISGLQAALGHEFIDSIENDLVYLDQSNQLRMFGNFRNLFEEKFPSISLAVQDELHDEVFTTGHIKAVSTDIGMIVYLTAPNSGRDYMFEVRQDLDAMGNIRAERFWHPPQVRNVSRFAVINGVLFGHSNSFPQLYQIWNTSQWHDDSPNATTTGVTYDCIMRLAYTQNGRRQGKLSFDKVYVEGYITQGTKLYGNVYFDYRGASGISNLDLNSTGNIATFAGAGAPSLGDASLGDNPLGDGLTIEANDQEQLAKFRIIKGTQLTDCFEYALEIYTQDLDSRFEILSIGANASLSESNPIEIIR